MISLADIFLVIACLAWTTLGWLVMRMKKPAAKINCERSGKKQVKSKDNDIKVQQAGGATAGIIACVNAFAQYKTVLSAEPEEAGIEFGFFINFAVITGWIRN